MLSMSRMFAGAVMLLAVLALLSPKEVVATPPQKVSGAMTFDTVADGLRKYHKETNVQRRVDWLTKLADTRDIRVQVALQDALRDPNKEVYWAALCLLGSRYLGATDPRTGRTQGERDALFRELATVYRRWLEFGHAAAARRRAAHLPR
jgi:hypothetical protein